MNQDASMVKNPLKAAELDKLTDRIIDARFAVHRNMGPGLSEEIYEECLTKELDANGIKYKCQMEIPIRYKGDLLKKRLRLDLLIEDEVILELKAVKEIIPLFEGQLLTYMRLTQKRVGYLINFNVSYMKYGIKRMRIG